MPERSLHRDRLVPGVLVAVGSLRLLPVERVALDAGGGGAATWVVARKEPWALVIQDGTDVNAIGPDGILIPIEAVRRGVPGLDELLAGQPSGIARHPGCPPAGGAGIRLGAAGATLAGEDTWTSPARPSSRPTV